MTRIKAGVRGLLALLVIATASVLVVGAATSTNAAGELAEGQKVAPPRENVTVVATDSNSWLGQGRDGPRARAELLAIGPSGKIIYYNDSHTRYWDVDPVEGTAMTVEYVAATHLRPEACGGEQVCTRNVVERVNLTTGNVTRVFSRVTPGKHSTRWHDADRIDDRHIVVADIAQDRVFVVNTDTGLVTWAWDAQSEYSTASSGGPYPGDWTHLNDVEVLPDGRIMASLRNHDQVVFLDRRRGLDEEWTLGADDNHETLYEQHNPDYISEENGGPAVLVAGSENNRLVEYQRTNGTWTRTWVWSDARLQWPRDADRLPNGNTLVTDSNGNRVFEVDESGDVVWQAEIAFPYEAERLGTGGESTGGQSAERADIQSRNAPGGSSSGEAGLSATVTAWFANGPFTNAVMYVLPVWVGPLELWALVGLLLTLLVWATIEAYWAAWRVSLRAPLRFERELDE